MPILIFGTGVCGSALGAFIARGGLDVTMLARGQRYEEIKQNGLILIDSQTKKRIEVPIPVITEEEYFENPIAFDFILVILGHNFIPRNFTDISDILCPRQFSSLGNNRSVLKNTSKV